MSYSCCPNMKSLITSHNSKLSRRCRKTGCNCRGGVSVCPLQGDCQTPSLVYKATVSTVEGRREYLGQTTITFKLIYNNHKNSFIKASKKHSTALSNYVWKLSNKGVDYSISWSSVSLARPYSREGKSCQLCLMEKTLTARSSRNFHSTKEQN